MRESPDEIIAARFLSTIKIGGYGFRARAEPVIGPRFARPDDAPLNDQQRDSGGR
jgi:hypothetical protein